MKHGYVKYALFALLAMFLIASSMAYHDVQQMAQHYCAMVEAGAWPDFKRSCAPAP